jgi:ferredoxin
VAPDLFVLDEEGYLSVASIDVPTGREDDAREAVASCPERAIRVSEQTAAANG